MKGKINKNIFNMRKFVKKFSAEKQEKKDSSIKNSGAGQDTGKIKKKKTKK